MSLPEEFARGFWEVAERRPDAVALTEHNGRAVSFGDLRDRVHAYAQAFRSRGLDQGGVVAALLSNRIEFVTTYLACIESGLYFVPVNFHLTDSEVSYILDNSQADLLVTEARFGPTATLAAHSAGLDAKHRLGVDDVTGFESLVALAAAQPNTFVDGAIPGDVIVYTSGTTGKPKGVRRELGRGDVLATLDLFASVVLGDDWRDGGVHLVSAPLYHRGPFIVAMVALHCGHRLVLMDRWTAEAALESIEREQVTTCYVVPTMMHRLVRLPESKRDQFDVASLRYVLHSAAPCPIETKRSLIEWWGPVVYETYGGTEGGGTRVTPAEWLERPGTVGRPWDGAEIHILDDDGNPCPPGVDGVVYIKPTSPNFEYFRDPDKTASIKVGHLHTLGDIGHVDDAGYLFLRGRRHDLIISGGVNIYPAEVEDALLSSPEVYDVAVVGVADPEWGESVKAIVIAAVGVNPDDDLRRRLQEHCRSRLASFKCPRIIEFRDSLPRTSAGKMYKRYLDAQ
ncbi:MAG: AMP-binding protein [Acidimicrobiales bacterium]